MIILLSPSKTLDFKKFELQSYTEPDFLDNTKYLVTHLKRYEMSDFQNLMGVSEKIAWQVLGYYASFSFELPSLEHAKQAILAFRGDVYLSLDALSFEASDFDFAQKHLRILSGLYGLLKPLDLIQPYRLEMGSKFKNSAMQDELSASKREKLSAYWSLALTNKLCFQSCIVNLASQEYASAIDRTKLKGQWIDVQFKELRNGQYKTIGILAKRARGLMARWIIFNKIIDPMKLKEFNEAGYQYSDRHSKQTSWVFIHE